MYDIIRSINPEPVFWHRLLTIDYFTFTTLNTWSHTDWYAITTHQTLTLLYTSSLACIIFYLDGSSLSTFNTTRKTRKLENFPDSQHKTKTSNISLFRRQAFTVNIYQNTNIHNKHLLTVNPAWWDQLSAMYSCWIAQRSFTQLHINQLIVKPKS